MSEREISYAQAQAQALTARETCVLAIYQGPGGDWHWTCKRNHADPESRDSQNVRLWFESESAARAHAQNSGHCADWAKDGPAKDVPADPAQDALISAVYAQWESLEEGSRPLAWAHYAGLVCTDCASGLFGTPGYRDPEGNPAWAIWEDQYEGLYYQCSDCDGLIDYGCDTCLEPLDLAQDWAWAAICECA